MKEAVLVEFGRGEELHDRMINYGYIETKRRILVDDILLIDCIDYEVRKFGEGNYHLYSKRFKKSLFQNDNLSSITELVEKLSKNNMQYRHYTLV